MLVLKLIHVSKNVHIKYIKPHTGRQGNDLQTTLNIITTNRWENTHTGSYLHIQQQMLTMNYRSHYMTFWWKPSFTTHAQEYSQNISFIYISLWTYGKTNVAFMPPPLGVGGIMFSGYPSVHLSARLKPEIPSFDLYMGPLLHPTNHDHFTACQSVRPSIRRGFWAFAGERMKGIAWNFTCWYVLPIFRTD